MINNDQFYAMIPNAIGYVSYKWKCKTKQMTNQEEQDFIDNFTREAMNVLMTKATYSYENIPSPLVAHFNARQEARRILDTVGPSVEIKHTDLQVGSKECLDYILKLQVKPEFRGWVNPGLIQLYTNVTQDLLNAQK